MQESFESLADAALLRKRLEAAFGGHPYGIALNYGLASRTHAVAINGLGTATPVHTGCLAKVLTASLIALAVADGKLVLTDSIGRFLPLSALNPALAEQLAAIRVHHLLTHSHGIDSALPGLALTRDWRGRIDIKRLLGGLRAEHLLAAPGCLFHSSNLGPWLAAAMLEALYRQPYAALLEHRLARPLRLSCRGGVPASSCPSVGGPLRLSADDLLQLAHLQGLSGQPGLAEVLRHLRERHCLPLPAWPPLGERISPGWIDFGGSFGQLGYGAASSGVLRFVPEHDLAISVTAAHPRLANAVMSTLFHGILPDFKPLTPLGQVGEGPAAAGEPGDFIGWFANNLFRLQLDQADNGCLRVRVYRRRGELGGREPEPFVKRYLKAVAPATFVPRQPERAVCPVLRFSGRDAGGFRYLETQAYLFSRCPAPGSQRDAVAALE